MHTKSAVIFFLWFIHSSTLAEESTLIETNLVDVRINADAGDESDENDVDLDDEIDDFSEEYVDEYEDIDEDKKEKTDAETEPNGEPVENGRLSSEFGWRKDPFTGRHQHHSGIDIAAEEGSEIKAVSSGKVTRAENNGKYGNLVEIDHGNDYKTRYGHNQEILVQVGDTVKQGETIAHVGSTGRSTGPHLHYEVLHQDTKVDPADFLEPKTEAVPDKSKETGKIEEKVEDEVFEMEVVEDEVYEAEVYEDDLSEEEFDEAGDDDSEES